MKLFNIIIILFSILILYYSCKQDDIIVPVTGRVVNSKTKEPVQDARIVYNADETVSTDSFGEFRLKYNLGNYLADSISFYVTKKNYKDKEFSVLVGNTQKDIYLIEIEPR